MPLRVIKKAPSKYLNGLGTFVLPCKRITFQFAPAAGSSNGMREFLDLKLKRFAQQNPEIEINVLNKTGHPNIKGEYTNGRSKQICVRNKSSDEIFQTANALRNSSGEALKKPNKRVESENQSIRGIWSPFHITPQNPKFKI